MTGPRQERKPLHGFAGLLAVALVAALGGTPLASAATTEWVVVDRNTGLAIGGVDPVAYFTDGEAKIGRGDLEFHHARAVWRFRNEGNRAVFMADPEIYMPRFGGYDPIAIGRGTGAAGNPNVWLIRDNRLYLFFSEDSRKAFTDDAERAVDAAERRWPEVLLTLSP
jgi:hypothetical protein